MLPADSTHSMKVIHTFMPMATTPQIRVTLAHQRNHILAGLHPKLHSPRVNVIQVRRMVFASQSRGAPPSVPC
jgi:hypothetical protein